MTEIFVVASPTVVFGGFQTNQTYLNGVWFPIANDGKITILDDSFVAGDVVKNVGQGYLDNILTFQTIQDPSSFGGINPDNSANGGPIVTAGAYGTTTTSPEMSSPLMTHYIDGGVQRVWKIAYVISDSKIALVDPFNEAAIISGGFGQVCSANFKAMRKVTISGTDMILGLAGRPMQTMTGTITIDIAPNSEGVVEPFTLDGNGTNATVTIEY